MKHIETVDIDRIFVPGGEFSFELTPDIKVTTTLVEWGGKQWIKEEIEGKDGKIKGIYLHNLDHVKRIDFNCHPVVEECDPRRITVDKIEESGVCNSQERKVLFPLLRKEGIDPVDIKDLPLPDYVLLRIALRVGIVNPENLILFAFMCGNRALSERINYTSYKKHKNNQKDCKEELEVWNKVQNHLNIALLYSKGQCSRAAWRHELDNCVIIRTLYSQSDAFVETSVLAVLEHTLRAAYICNAGSTGVKLGDRLTIHDYIYNVTDYLEKVINHSSEHWGEKKENVKAVRKWMLDKAAELMLEEKKLAEQT